jgi:hypothetical protein
VMGTIMEERELEVQRRPDTKSVHTPLVSCCLLSSNWRMVAVERLQSVLCSERRVWHYTSWYSASLAGVRRVVLSTARCGGRACLFELCCVAGGEDWKTEVKRVVGNETAEHQRMVSGPLQLVGVADLLTSASVLLCSLASRTLHSSQSFFHSARSHFCPVRLSSLYPD